MLDIDELKINIGGKKKYVFKNLKIAIYKFILSFLKKKKITKRQLGIFFNSIITIFTNEIDYLKNNNNDNNKQNIFTLYKLVEVLKKLKIKNFDERDIKNIIRKRIKKINKKLIIIEDIDNNKLKTNSVDFIEKLYNINGRNNIMNETIKYYNNLSLSDKKQYNTIINKVMNVKDKEPYIISLLKNNIDNSFKKHIISMINTAYTDNNSKLNSWIDNVRQLPLGIYKGNNFSDYNSSDKIKKLLNDLQMNMDNAVYGHRKAKRKIIQFVAQKISNPNSNGNVLGLYGVPGNGKTSLIKNGIAKALNRPFIFISLGGAQDSSFLEGHSFTYEGSIYGRIAEGLIKSGCMNPIIYFDELDKVSSTNKGKEIINLLIHMIDPVQNKHFIDKYFHGLELDLSKCTFMFSFNEPRKVNYILLDRITKIETKFLSLVQKKIILKDYLLPSMLDEFGLNNKNISFKDDIITSMIEDYTCEGGVRGLKKIIRHIISEINLEFLTTNNIKFPLLIDNIIFKKYMLDFHKIENQIIHNTNTIGVINGMWAGSMGIGGILPIEVLMIPNKAIMSIKATGSLEKVIKESTHVACSLAWNHLNKETQQKWLNEWETNPQGFHIHCPEGAVSKDGPSAGTALTVAIYSVLTKRPIKNNISITGEINLQGLVLIIGGLEEKLLGAKKAGVKLALIPYANLKDIERIKKRNSKLFDNNFNYQAIKTLDEVLEYVF